VAIRRCDASFSFSIPGLTGGIVSRREFIGGAAMVSLFPAFSQATEAAGAAFSVEESPVAFRFRLARKGKGPLDLIVSKSYWGDIPGSKVPPKFSIERSDRRPVDPQSATVVLRVGGARFAGRKNVAAELIFDLRGVDCRVCLKLSHWPRANTTTSFDWIDFAKFVGEQPDTAAQPGQSSGASHFVTKLTKAETAAILKDAFGGAISSNSAARLSVGPDWRWTLSTIGPRDRFQALQDLSGSPRQGGAAFAALSFGPAEAASGVFDRDILRRAFSEGVPENELSFCGIASGSENVVIAQQLLLAANASVATNSNSLTIEASPGRGTGELAFQNFGDAARTVSGLKADVDVSIRSFAAGSQQKAARLVEGPFRCEQGLTVSWRRGNRRTVYGRLPLQRSAQRIDTSHGAFVVEALDDTIASPGDPKLHQGLKVEVRSDGRGTSIQEFELRALLREASVHLPSGNLQAGNPDEPVFSRLDFVGAECVFELASLARAKQFHATASIVLGQLDAIQQGEPAPVQIDLTQATLRVVRPSDLLSLKFRFVGIQLDVWGAKAVLRSIGQGSCSAFKYRGGTPTDDILVDGRSKLVVEFPPQHVAERAYFRQLDEGENAPDVVLDNTARMKLEKDFALLDRFASGVSCDLTARVEARRRIGEAKIEAAKLACQSEDRAVRKRAERFRQVSEELEWVFSAKPETWFWPEDQAIYIGPEWLDVDVRKYVKEFVRKLSIADYALLPITSRLPQVDIRDGDYVLWLDAYERLGTARFGASLPNYCGPETILEMIELKLWNVDQVKALLDDIDCERDVSGADGPETFPNGATEARLSGTSRLAFHVRCGDGLPFTVENLTDWSQHELVVIRRAQKLFAYDNAGGLPAPWARDEIIDPESMLRFQGISSASGLRGFLDGGKASAAQRMSEIFAATTSAPSLLETSIEMPFRLMLSPAQDARWRTPRARPGHGVPIPLWQASLEDDASRASLRAIWSPDFRPEVYRDHAAVPLHGPWAPWSLDRDSDDNAVSGQPERFRATMDARDRHEIVTLSSVWGLPVGGRRNAQGEIVKNGDQIEPPEKFRLKGTNGTDAIYVPRSLQVSELSLSALGGSVDLDTRFVPQAAPDMAMPTGPRLFEALSVERWRHRAVLGRDVSVEVVYKGFLFPLGHRASLVKLTERRFMKRKGASGPSAYLIQRMFLRIGYPEKEYAAVGQPYEGRRFPPRHIEILTRRTPDLLDPWDTRPGGLKPNAFQELGNGAVYFTDAAGHILPGLCFWPRTARFKGADVRFEFQIDRDGGSVSMPLIFADNTAVENAATMTALTRYYNTVENRTLRTVEHNGAPRRYATEAKEGEATYETVNWVLRAEGRRSTRLLDGGGDTVQLLNDDFVMDALLRGADQPPFYPLLDQARLRLRQVAKMTGRPVQEAVVAYDVSYAIKGFEPPAEGPGPQSPNVLLAVLGGGSNPQPVLDYGSNGQRGGGVGRPETLIVALSTTHGPLGGNAPIVPAAKPSAPSPRQLDGDDGGLPMPGNFADLFAKFDPARFFHDAKLLGILDLGQVLEALGATPKLLEQIEYLSHSSWSLTRQTILDPLRSILDAFNQTITSKFDPKIGSIAARIAQFYPDVQNAFKDLDSSVTMALAAADPAPDQQIRIVSDIYGKSRAFIAALQRLATDPIGPLKKALSGVIDQITKLTEIDRQYLGLGKFSDWLDRLFPENPEVNVWLSLNLQPAWENVPRAVSEMLVRRWRRSISVAFNDPALQTERAQADKVLATFLAKNIESDPGFQQLGATASRELKQRWDDLKGGKSSYGMQVLELLLAVDQVRRIAEQPQAASAITSTVIPKVSDLLQRTATLFLSEKIGRLRTALEQLKAETSKVIGSMIADDPPLARDLSTVRGCLNWAARALGTDVVSLDISTEFSEFRNAFEAWKEPPEIQPTDDPVEAARRRLSQAIANVTRVQTSGVRLFEKLAAVVADAEKFKKYGFKAKAGISCIVYVAAYSLTNDVAYEKFIAAAEVFLPAEVLAEARSILPRLRTVSQPIRELGEKLDGLKAVMERYLSARLTLEDWAGSEPADVGEALAQLTRTLQERVVPNLPDVLNEATAARNRLLARLDAALLIATNDALKLASGLAIPLQSIMAMLVEVSKGLTESARKLPSIEKWEQDPAIAQVLGKPIRDLRQYLEALKSELAGLKDNASDAKKALADFERDARFDNAEKASAVLGKVRGSASLVQKRIVGIASAVQEIGQALLKGNLALLVDVDAPRRAVEQLVRDLVPHKATMTYDLDGEVKPLENIFIPDPSAGKRLTISSRTEIDLLKSATPQFSISGKLDPFAIHLLGDFIDVVKINFHAATFEGGQDKPFRISVDMKSIELGKAVEFLKQLQSFLTPSDGNGFFLKASEGFPGLEVGYGINLGTISLGPVSFINVSLNASCLLPFDKRDAQFKVSLSRPEAPFLISVGIYGGGGYLGLIGNGKSIVGFEASFEFGGVSAFAFGPLNGIGRLTTGIFVRKIGPATTIEGFFFAGGSARIACFGVSASLVVRISMQPGGAMAGQAIFTFSFSLGMAHIDFQVPVWKTQAALGSKSADISPELPIRYAGRAASDARHVVRISNRPRAGQMKTYVETVTPERDWQRYQNYFDLRLRPVKED
jgi:hypothetical protein